MTTKYFIVSVRGQPKASLTGTRDDDAFMNMAKFQTAGSEVTRYAFWAKWGWQANETWATSTLQGVMKADFARFYPGEDFSSVRFIFFGASAGAISVLALAYHVPDSQIAYIGLADAAFYAGDSAFLQVNPLSKGYFANENYFQTADQHGPFSSKEIHGPVAAPFANFDMTASLGSIARNTGGGAHGECVNLATPKISLKISECIRGDRSS
jgi:hypothetical protein